MVHILVHGDPFFIPPAVSWCWGDAYLGLILPGPVYPQPPVGIPAHPTRCPRGEAGSTLIHPRRVRGVGGQVSGGIPEKQEGFWGFRGGGGCCVCVEHPPGLHPRGLRGVSAKVSLELAARRAGRTGTSARVPPAGSGDNRLRSPPLAAPSVRRGALSL